MSQRLDTALVKRKLLLTRNQAQTYIKLGHIKINNKVIKTPDYIVNFNDTLSITSENYVSRAALKLESVVSILKINFDKKNVLDIGSSTGGFTDYALKNGANKVIDIEVGSNQLHPTLINNPKIELHENTDIRKVNKLSSKVDIVLVDVSFVSLTNILPSIKKLIETETEIIAMFKPQFEASSNLMNKGIIKNQTIRRQIIQNFEKWLRDNDFIIVNKSDSSISGSKGNIERFYLLRIKSL